MAVRASPDGDFLNRNAGSPIAREIRTNASYVTPATYGWGNASPNFTQGTTSLPGLLSFYHNLTLLGDQLTNQFVPFSAVSGVGRNPKIFAVGILPPSQNVTERLLDRSASIIRDLPEDQIEGNTPGEDLGPDAREGSIYENTANSDTSASGGTTWRDHPDEFWAQYVEMCRRLRQDPDKLAAVLFLESRFDPSAQNIQGGRIIAQGLNQYIESTAKNPKLGNMTEEQWNNFANLSASEQLPFVERYYTRLPTNSSKGVLYKRTFGGFNNPDGTIYASSAHQQATGLEYSRGGYQQKAIEQNKGFVTAHPDTGQPVIFLSTLAAKVEHLPPPGVLEKIAAAEAFLDAGGAAPPLPVAQDSDAINSWKQTGSGAAQTAASNRGKLANTDLVNTELGRKFSVAQAAQIKAVKNALEAMAQAPPLRLLVNPNKFSVKAQKIVSDGNWGRNGPIIEFWGDDQDKISGSGQVAGFYALDVNPALGQGGPGLTRNARNFSEAYLNFQSLWLLYRNNGGLYTQDLGPQERNTVLSTVGSVYLFYDSILYLGSFDSFNVTEADTKPFTLEYSFEFTVRAAFLLDFPDEETYGSPQTFTQRRDPTQIPTRANIPPFPEDTPTAAQVLSTSPRSDPQLGLSDAEVANNQRIRSDLLAERQAGTISREQLQTELAKYPVP